MEVDLFKQASLASFSPQKTPDASFVAVASCDASLITSRLDKTYAKNDANDAILSKRVYGIPEYPDAELWMTQIASFASFWPICNSINASELDAEMLAWGIGHGCKDAVEAIRSGVAKGRGWIDRCLGSIARRRCGAEPCYSWLADHRHGAEWRRLRAIAGIPDAMEPPAEPLPDPDYVTLPLDRLDQRVMEAIANGEVHVLRPGDAGPCWQTSKAVPA